MNVNLLDTVWTKRIRKALANHDQKTITYGQLRKKTLIKRGLSETLFGLRQRGYLSFETGANGAMTDSMEITINETVSPDQVRFINGGEIWSGRSILQMFGFDLRYTEMTVSADNSLFVYQEGRGVTLITASGYWERVS